MTLLRLSFVTAVLVSFALPVAAEGGCNIPAFVRPNLPGAPVVVDAPADGAAHLGAMPMVNDPERGMMGALAVVTAVKNGFAAVTGVKPWAGEPVALEGWVMARDLAFMVQTTKGFAGPDEAADVLWSGEAIYPDMFAGIEACQGEWVGLRLAGVADPVWVRGVCAAQNGGCDGVTGD